MKDCFMLLNMKMLMFEVGPKSNTDSQEDTIPNEDDYEVGEELGSLRNERKYKIKKEEICSN
ncbi:hypothetical protein H5410_027775 [Solanum commersonii]|uniref:Uncharacterized protein n=1 Tax=Solanum commersonii TaxID=4109 RepID=A0A9J5Z039_SOLCO|nr:hypothetical protein H5410_027775 [Solanum commersonii]